MANTTGQNARWVLREQRDLANILARAVHLEDLAERMAAWGEQIELIQRADGWGVPWSVLQPVCEGARESAACVHALAHDLQVCGAEMEQVIGAWVRGVVAYAEGEGRVAQRPPTPTLTSMFPIIQQHAVRMRTLVRATRSGLLPMRLDVAGVLGAGLELCATLPLLLSRLEMEVRLIDRTLHAALHELETAMRRDKPQAVRLSEWLTPVAPPESPAVQLVAMGHPGSLPPWGRWASEHDELRVDREPQAHWGHTREQRAGAARIFPPTTEIADLREELFHLPLRG